jgi:Fe-Mn family superoxide dismutase
MKKAFGSMEEIKAEFAKAAGSVFGSGWAWIAADSDKNLFITSTPNQDNPLMSNIAEKVGTPILGIDVWEHAYYLNYQNKRKDYISNFMEIINWDQVAANYDAIS